MRIWSWHHVSVNISSAFIAELSPVYCCLLTRTIDFIFFILKLCSNWPGHFFVTLFWDFFVTLFGHFFVTLFYNLSWSFAAAGSSFLQRIWRITNGPGSASVNGNPHPHKLPTTPNILLTKQYVPQNWIHTTNLSKNQFRACHINIGPII